MSYEPRLKQEYNSKVIANLKEEFGYKTLKGYDTQRLYAYLAERYLSYWFKKYSKFKELPWAIVET